MLKLLIGSVVGVLIASSALGQNYPERPVKIIMPYTAGGATDVMGRFYAERLSRELGQSFVIDNRPGAGGTIGTAAAAQAAPDGYTLTVGNAATHAMNMGLYKKPGYEAVNDFEGIGRLGNVTMAIAVTPRSGVQSWPDLLEQGKSGKLNIALPSTSATLINGLMVRRLNSGLHAVPYKGSASAMTDLLGGHVQVTIDTVSAMQPYAQAGTLVPLAVFSQGPSEFLPGVKSVVTDYRTPGFDVGGWFALFAPKGTPVAVIEKIGGALRKIAADPETRPQLMKLGFDPVPVGDSQSLKSFVTSERDKWVGLINAANITPE